MICLKGMLSERADPCRLEAVSVCHSGRKRDIPPHSETSVYPDKRNRLNRYLPLRCRKNSSIRFFQLHSIMYSFSFNYVLIVQYFRKDCKHLCSNFTQKHLSFLSAGVFCADPAFSSGIALLPELLPWFVLTFAGFCYTVYE